MKILVLNAGSSSLKYQLIDMSSETVLAKGNCDRIGIDGHLSHKTAFGFSLETDQAFASHNAAFETIIHTLVKAECRVIDSLSEISAVGHRVPHGGEKFTTAVKIDEGILHEIESVSELAPLHNPACIAAIKACRKVLGSEIPQVAVFDTAFHHTISEKAYIYAIPYEYFEEDRVRRYGFHGTSHSYVSRKAAKIIGRPVQELKLVTCHLGNGSSITAIDRGQSIDTSMGFTPIAGIVMGSRCGDIDPSILSYLCNKHSLTYQEFMDILNKNSGLVGISGLTSDLRDLLKAAEAGHHRAALAISILAYQVKKYIGAYAAAMGGLDAVVFTGGIGENSAVLRADICSNLEFLGIRLDEQMNKDHGKKDRMISADESPTNVLVVLTNEELKIARDTALLIGYKGNEQT